MAHSDPSEPGLVLGRGREPGTMVAALYGDLTPSPWHDPEHDAYQMFVQRSLAMGWLDDADSAAAGGVRRAPGLWGMNDAGWTHPLALPGGDLLAWFQVATSEVADDRPLPVQPFLRCAVDAAARVGDLSLSAVQVLLPVPALDPAARPPYPPATSTIHWFAERNPDGTTPITMTVECGNGAMIGDGGQLLADDLSRWSGEVFCGGSSDRAGGSHTRPPPFDDSLCGGPLRHLVSLRGDVTEWTCDAVGWLLEVLADVAARRGVASSLVVTVARD